jgi:FKBP-type peptidyl-prolyl cis-trans isomerase
MFAKRFLSWALRTSRWVVLIQLLLLSAVTRAQTGPVTADSLSGSAASLTTAGGVRYTVLAAGSGARPLPRSRVTVAYRGYLPTGQLFDSSPTNRPLRFRVGQGEVIPGWDELLPLLAVGTRVRAWIPARLAYGARGVKDPDDNYIIPPDTDLVFMLELLSAR